MGRRVVVTVLFCWQRGGRRVSRLAIGRLNGLGVFIRVERYTVLDIFAAHGIRDFGERRGLVTVAGATALAAANASCDALICFYLAHAVIEWLGFGLFGERGDKKSGGQIAAHRSRWGAIGCLHFRH